MTKPRGCVEVDNIEIESDEQPYQADEIVLPYFEVERIRCLVDETVDNYQQIVNPLSEPLCEHEFVGEEVENNNGN